ncbi:sugar MFS transporter [Microbulbifer salipaludis]|uniref:Sugar MFS transporter n=1 Tax=Microbulbifer salipaludis TaxID=187980 RepID=A0ABS3E6Q0_9GAMM|nr:sugar MFS transporter [Microbulbifer salipaludis]MBN8430988.1 sugar MFS transporter [Microbulbifer salipaludis]
MKGLESHASSGSSERTGHAPEAVGSVAVGREIGLVALTSLFFIWGFITGLNDILVPHLKNVFDLTYTMAVLVQFCFFAAYFIVSVPAGSVIKRVGFQLGLVVGLLVASAGCLIFIPAARLQIYEMFLLGLFVLAGGIAILQVSANPFVVSLGSESTAPSRLNLAQAFNSLGTTLAPAFGGVVIFSAVYAISPSDPAASVESFKAQEAALVEAPYFWLALVLLMLVAFFSWVRMPVVLSDGGASEDVSREVDKSFQLLRHPKLLLGAIGIFVYVGAEVAIGSFLINFFGEPSLANMDPARAATYVSLYWGAAMTGRFLGAGILYFVRPGFVLAVCGVAAASLTGLAMVGSGMLSVWAIVAVGLCNSIMFPTIFSLALGGLGRFASQGSGVLCMAIVGGAIVPLCQGVMADAIGIQLSFVVPALCYCYIVYYGISSPLLRNRI